MSADEEPKEIAANSIRSGLAELEIKASQVLQRLENIKSVEPQQQQSPQQHDGADAARSENAADVGNAVGGVGAAATASADTMPDRKLPADILKNLEGLIAESEEDEAEYPLPALDDVSHLALISHSIIAYLSHLDRHHLLRVTDQISGEVSKWLGTFFRFKNAASSFHTDNAEAILRIVRLTLSARCPGGMIAMMHPCFYISENSTLMRLQYACRQLGLPLEAIRIVPVNSVGAMDVAQLQRQIQADVANKQTPLLVFADVGASVCGYVDSLNHLRDICRTHNMWIHATGHGLAALVCSQGPQFVSNTVDSIVLNLGSWLGIPSLPIVLLHRPLDNAALTAFESDPILSRRLNALSLWTSLQALGADAISERVNVAFQTCIILFEITSKCEGIRVASRVPGGASATSLTDVINKPLDVNLLFDAAVPVVVFQFDGSTSLIPNADKDSEPVKVLEKVSNSSYFDRLNSWMGQILQRDCPNFDFEIIEHPKHGTCLRYCPFELGLGEQPPTAENLEHFAQSLESHVDILRATIKHKATFISLVEKSDVLRLVNLPDWAGMGGVRFVPEGWESMLTDQAKSELNKLNIDLVETLKSTDNAFSLGEGLDGLICVRFGMVTNETDVEELLDLVVSVGKKVQENSRVLDTMSEIVKKGIEAATADLQRESEEKLWQEGILRHVPVVGRVVNWWSPPTKESGIKGRSLNLTQGVVESTENIYKYHMQMTGENNLPANKSPPTPMVQTPVATAVGVAATIPPVFPTNTTTANGGNPFDEANALNETDNNVQQIAAASNEQPESNAVIENCMPPAPEDLQNQQEQLNRSASQSSAISSAPDLVAINSVQ